MVWCGVVSASPSLGGVSVSPAPGLVARGWAGAYWHRQANCTSDKALAEGDTLLGDSKSLSWEQHATTEAPIITHLHWATPRSSSSNRAWRAGCACAAGHLPVRQATGSGL